MSMIDLVGELPTNPRGGPGRGISYTDKRGVVVHYNGPPVPESVPDLDWIRTINQWHLDRDWSMSPGSGTPIRGDGLMYHRVIGRDGDIYRTRPDTWVLWHCGSWPENETHMSVYVRIGGDQRANPAQLLALREVVDGFVRDLGLTRADIIGHQEVDWTDCPGTLMEDFVLPWREEIEMTTNGKRFTETGFYVGGAFWDYWRDNGGLMVFGYPLSDEIEEDGRTVQYFERAVFEWHPENDRRFRVLLRRLGADALRNSEIRV